MTNLQERTLPDPRIEPATVHMPYGRASDRATGSVHLTELPGPAIYMQYGEIWKIIYEPQHDKTNKVTVCPAKTQISLGIRPVLSESSLCTQWVPKGPSFFMQTAKTDLTGRMLRRIWVFAGHTCHFVGFVTLWLKSEDGIQSQWRLLR